MKILHSLMCSPYLILICTTTSVQLYPIFSLCALKAAAKTLYSSRPLVSSSFLASLGVSIVPSRDDTLHPQNFQQEQLPKEETASEESLTPHKLHTASSYTGTDTALLNTDPSKPNCICGCSYLMMRHTCSFWRAVRFLEAGGCFKHWCRMAVYRNRSCNLRILPGDQHA